MSEPKCAVGAPEGAPTVTVHGVELAYSETGAGVPLVCLHATGHGARDFAAIPQLTAHDVRVLAFDWPGHGRSGDDPQPASAARYCELLAAALDALNIDRAIILGNSIGGAAAIQFAAQHPDKVIGLILADPGGLLPINGFVRGFCGLMERFFRAGANGRRWFGPAFAMYYRMVLSRGPIQDHRARIVAAGYDHAAVLAQAWHSFGQPDADLRRLVPDIACPVLVAWARHDKIIQYRQCRSALERFPDAQTILFDASHSAFLEAPEAFAHALEPFLDRLGVPTKTNTIAPYASVS